MKEKIMNTSDQNSNATFILYANKNQLTARRRGPVTSGSVHVCTARFEFSDEWNGLERIAVFKAGDSSRSVLLDEANTCEVPWETLAAYMLECNSGCLNRRKNRSGEMGPEAVVPQHF